MPCVALSQDAKSGLAEAKAPIQCDAAALTKSFEAKLGRVPNKNEQLTLDALTNDRDRRRMLQVIEFEGEEVDVTKISLPKLPDTAEVEQVVDEELDPQAWRQIASICGSHAPAMQESRAKDTVPQAEGSAAPAIAPKSQEFSSTADFSSVKERRETVKGAQDKQHSKLSEALAGRKEKRLAERQSQMEKAQQNPKHALSESQLKKLKSDQAGAENGEKISAVSSAIAASAARPDAHPGARKAAEGTAKDEEAKEVAQKN